MKNKMKSFIGTSLVVLILSQSFGTVSAATESSSTETGRWMSGEYHAHTIQSSDASESFMKLENVLNAGFRENIETLPKESEAALSYGEAFDFLVLTDHLRNSPRDPEGNEKSTARWGAIQDQQEVIQKLQNAGKYKGKLIYSGFEWDMMGLDHASVGIIDSKSDEVPMEAIHQFEYLYSYDTSGDRFTANESQLWGERQSQAAMKADKNKIYEAINWLNKNYPDSFVLPNHPSRHNGDSSGVVTIKDLRLMNDAAPEIVFGMEGMPGNQMAAGGNRSELTDVYGGADVMIAQVGGVWDALLGEGRHFWNFTNSDFHFKVSSNRNYSSGYWPSEYARNYVWVEGDTFHDVVDGMRSGKSFSVYGNLIDALDFNINNSANQADMGEELQVTEGDLTTIKIRFKSPEYNNYTPISDHETSVTNQVKVDHIDLISGEVAGKVDESEYATRTTNDTSKVVARFTEKDWGAADEEGYYTISCTVPADTDRYYRLRGTNLGVDVAGFTVNGELMKDESFSEVADNEERFNLLNDRNYTSMWFYSNPIFVDVAAYSDEQAVADTVAFVTEKLGDTSSLTSDFTLPLVGLHGTAIEWKSSSENIVIENDSAKVTRPSASKGNVDVVLNAAISRGNKSIVQAYTVTVKAEPSNTGTPEIPEEPIQPPTKPILSLTDIKDHWANASIQFVLNKGLFFGTSKTTFSPNDSMTRGMLVTVIHRLAGETKGESQSFQDVSKNSYYSDAIAWAKSNGIVNGVTETNFAPNQSITREQFAVILYNYAKELGLKTVIDKDTLAFTDADQVASWASEAMKWSVNNQLFQGTNNNLLNPSGLLTRAEAATIIERFVTHFKVGTK